MRKLLLVFFGTFIPLAVTFSAASGESSNWSMKRKWQNGARTIELKIAGAVEFTDDDRDVMSLSPYGHFSLKESRWWVHSRRYEVTADGSGHLARFYQVDGEAKPLDNEGRAWLAQIMPEIIRETGAGAGPRVQRILRQRGPSGVLAEIRLIHSDESKRIYLEEVIRNGSLTPEQLSSAMREARNIGSDEEKSEFLIAMAPIYLKDDLRDALFGAVDTISSDDEHRRVLSELVQQDSRSVETLTLALRSAAKISSDDEKAAILREVAERYRGNEVVRRPYFKAADSISSDEERRQVLSAVLKIDGDDRETLVDCLRSAAGISSDEEKAGILIEACHYYTEDDAVRRAFFNVTNGISSDEERARVLSELVHNPGLKLATLQEIAKSAKQISSDEEKAKVLVEIAALGIQDVAVRSEFFEAVNSISSDEERGRVLSVVMGKVGAGDSTLTQVLESAERISSDEEKAKVLVEMTRMDMKNDGLRAAFFKATDSISSDEEHGHVLSSLLKRRGLPTEAVIDVIESAERISSDEVKASILKQVIESYCGDPAVRSRLRGALESLQSNDQYRELMSALSKQETTR
jgi:hypothetical protein